MKKIGLAILTTSVLFLSSCSDENHENHLHNQAEVEYHDEHAEHAETMHHEKKESTVESDSDKLELNHGEKWQLSESLMAAAGEMADDVSDFYHAHKTTLDDYHALAEKLSGGINKLVNKCELPDGEAHENLHKWLHPYMEDVAALKKVDNDADARKQLEKIRKSFITFKMFFK